MSASSLESLKIFRAEANYWWRKNEPTGALLNNLMILFIVAPIALVLKNLYVLSFIVFSLMIPYGFLVRQLAVVAVRNHLATHPEAVAGFLNAGIICPIGDSNR